MNAPPIQSSPAAAPANAPKKTVVLAPGFLRAWRGIWLLTWKSQFTWKRLPALILGLLVLPLLVYITTPSSEKWARRPTVFSDPIGRADGLVNRLVRSKIPLSAEQKIRVQQIFMEEFNRSEKELRANEDAGVDRHREQVKDCYERIQARAQPILDPAQFAQLQNIARRNGQMNENFSNNGPAWTRTAPFYHWLIDFYFFIVLPLNCVRLSGGLIRDELQTDTLGFLTTRPPGRGRLLILKYFSQAGWLQGIMLIETVLVFSAGALREIPSLGALLPLFLAAQFLAVFAWSALGIFLGQITKRYVAMAIVYGAFVEMGLGRIPTNINNLSITRHLKTLLAHNPALQSTYDWAGTGVPQSVAALVIATAVFLGMAALLFTLLEYHHTAEMQK